MPSEARRERGGAKGNALSPPLRGDPLPQAGEGKESAPVGDPRNLYRPLCTGLQFWTVCEKACRRAKACAGDSQVCFERWWPIVPEGIRLRLRVFIKTCGEGGTRAAAWAKAQAEAERWAEHIARVDAETDAELRARSEAREAAASESTADVARKESDEAPAAREERRGPRARVL